MYRNVFRNQAEDLSCGACIDIVERKKHLKAQHPKKGGAHLSHKERNAAAEVQHVEGSVTSKREGTIQAVRRKTRSDDAPHQMK